MQKRTLISFGIAVFCMGAGLLIEGLTTPEPQERNIHIEAFRYGVEPSIIRANRGDRLCLTFSSRDTAHSFFLQDYNIDAKLSPAGNHVIELFEARDPERRGQKVRQVELTAGRPGLVGHLNTVSRHRCHVYCGPMHGFEQGDLIVRPNWLLAGALGLLVGLPLAGLYRIRSPLPAVAPERPDVNLLASMPWLRAVLRWRPLQFYLTLPFVAVFLLAILAGLFGTKVGGRNFGVMATWVVWMFVMTVVLMPINARLWCAVCPLPVLGEFLQRGSLIGVRPGRDGSTGNSYLGWGRSWPRVLRAAWVRQLVFLCIGTLAASFAGMPKWTALMLLTLFGVATVMGVIWERRSFCRFVCPVISLLNVYSGAGRLMLRSADPARCRECKDKHCYRGNAEGWGCPFGVAVPSLKSNADCGVCSECFKTCPHDNATLSWRRGPMRNSFRTTGHAWQVLAMLTLGMAYSLIILSPWPWLRDVVNIVDRASWPRFLLYVVILWGTTLGVMPGLYWLANGLGLRWSGISLGKEEAFRRFAPTFVPLGLALWISFFAAMMMVNYRFVLLTISDPFNWGWDLLGTAGLPWLQLWPGAIPWIQVGLLLAGLAFSFRCGYRSWLEATGDPSRALRGFLPAAGMLMILASGMVIYFAHF